jgi:hypothetical protein
MTGKSIDILVVSRAKQYANPSRDMFVKATTVPSELSSKGDIVTVAEKPSHRNQQERLWIGSEVVSIFTLVISNARL